MKKTGRRSLSIHILTIGFLIGISYFVFSLIINAESWVMKPINGHLSGDELAKSGTIYDRNGIVLAESINNNRVYNNDSEIRKAMLHVVGDNSPNISTSIQNIYKSELFGYSFIFGLSAPDSFRSSKNIILSLDSNLCKLAYQKLGNYKGAVAVYNYKTGEILCMASTPSYDPKDPPDIVNDSTGKYDGVYLNRVLSGAITPGSIFKIITSACAIDNINNIDSKSFECHQSTTVEGEKITCVGWHGNIDIEDGFTKSCNIVFSELAIQLGNDKMTNTANKMLFNKNMSIDNIPLAKSIYNVKEASQGSLGWSGVGQYTDLVNPAHMLMIMGSIANKGTYIKPYFIDHMINNIGTKSHVNSSVEGTEMINSNTADSVKILMRNAVKFNYGDSLFDGMEICAKTGTAEISNDKSKEPHAWMVGFSQDNKYPLAFVVAVENGGSGLKTAGKIASSVLIAVKKTMN